MRRPAFPLALVGVGSAVVAVSAVGLLTTPRGSAVRPFGDASRPPVAVASSARPTPGGGAAAGRPATTSPARSPAREAAADPAPPAALTLEAQHVIARVVPVVADAAVLDVPPNPAEVGWWIASAPAGSAFGSTVIVGHVDSAQNGLGALFAVGRGAVKSGSAVTVSTASGARFRYVVYAQEIIPKTQGLPSTLFGLDSPPRLILITCGGPFDRRTGSYLDNVVLYASPTA